SQRYGSGILTPWSSSTRSSTRVAGGSMRRMSARLSFSAPPASAAKPHARREAVATLRQAAVAARARVTQALMRVAPPRCGDGGAERPGRAWPGSFLIGQRVTGQDAVVDPPLEDPADALGGTGRVPARGELLADAR